MYGDLGRRLVCSGKLFWVWGLYAVFMLGVFDYMTRHGIDVGASWVVGLAVGALVAVKTGMV